jgi:PAS domain S-box-containing protein
MTSSLPVVRSIFCLDMMTLINCQQGFLADIDAGAAVADVLSRLAKVCEEASRPQAYISFLFKSEQQALQHVATDSLPPSYREIFNRLDQSSWPVLSNAFCPKAEPYFISDIADEVTRPRRELDVQSALRAFWSWPIGPLANKIHGVLACWLTQPAVPTSTDMEVLAVVAQTVRLVMHRQAAIHSAREARDRHRQIFDSATDFAIIATDLRGVVTEWNEGAHRILGWTACEAIGYPLSRIFTPEDVASNTPEVEMQLALDIGHAPDERWHLKKSGDRFCAVGQTTPLKSADGSVVGFVKVMRDRTIQKFEELGSEALTASLEAQVEHTTRERNRIWENSLDLLLEIDPDGFMRAVNPVWTVSLGYTRDELVDQYFAPFVHPDDIQATAEAIKIASSGPLEHFENRMLHKNGAYRCIAWRAAPGDGLVYANGRDITVEKAQAEQLATANDVRLEVSLAAGGMGVWEWDIRTDEITWLNGAAKMHGIEAAEQPPGMSVQIYMANVYPDDRDSLLHAIAQALPSASNFEAEYRVVWPDGTIHWLDARGRILRDENGAPLRMIGVNVDVTERKRIEDDLTFLANASTELAGLIEPAVTLERLAYMAVPRFADWCTADLLQGDGTLQRVAAAHADASKVALAEELHRKMPTEVDAPHGVWNVVRTGRAEFVHQIKPEFLQRATQDPERRAVVLALGLCSYIIAPLTAHGRVLGAVSFITAESGRLYGPKDLKLAEDLAHRAAIALDNAKLYQAAEQSNQAKSVFLATLSHELRNPLAAIENGLALVRLTVDDRERVEKIVSMVGRQTAQLTRLVDDLMDASRIATAKIVLKNEWLSLGEILDDAVNAVRSEIDAKNHELSIHVPHHPIRVWADPARLLQIFSNLLTNAARYTDPGGTIDVSIEDKKMGVVVRVRDTGIGIKAEMLPRIFQMFTQVGQPLQHNQGGLGIGLAIVEGLVKLHGGRVEVLSAGLGMGSEFVVHLPHADVKSGQDNSLPVDLGVTDPGLYARHKILLVDDNKDAVVALADILRILNQDVELAHDGLSAITAAVASKPDVVILDIGLPDIDGYEVARSMHMQFGIGKPFLIAITGWGQEIDKQRAFDAGFDSHLLKPVSVDSLMEVLQGVKN